jgi:carbonic anhydrase/acetyltransferase-like protein (isoleucine patch superfamily)
MRRSLLRRISNRWLHLLARTLPGSKSIRPFLHRLRGVKIGKDVFIGDDVYLENEYPEAVDIQNGVHISVRAVILAHTLGIGSVVIEKDAFIGINAVIASSGSKTLRIGEGAVVGAGVVVTRNVPARVFIANETPKPIATVGVPLPIAETVEDFARALSPIKRPSTPAPSGAAGAQSSSLRSATD